MQSNIKCKTILDAKQKTVIVLHFATLTWFQTMSRFISRQNLCQCVDVAVAGTDSCNTAS